MVPVRENLALDSVERKENLQEGKEQDWKGKKRLPSLEYSGKT